MFSYNSFEKSSSVAPENSSLGRSNISNRFPVGITSLGDENQQIRIQLAVHKYNNSTISPTNSRRSYISPIRHSFLKNSPKAKIYDGNIESTLKNEKKTQNQYEGVGTFPTVHLRKSAVRYRPMRRFNEVKIPHPELPMSRFLNHLPELCPDLKSSTRSVLDVLQDLSAKRIHSKDEGGSTIPQSRGLGGDMPMDAEAVYKPLFVQKPKVNTVLTRDNTAQTMLTHGFDSESPRSSISSTKSDASDPRAELRRKLAKQNNEIFASLSSSISSSFPIKRKLDKVTARDSEHRSDESAVKKAKRFENHTINNYEENGAAKSVNGFKTTITDESVKLSRKSKLNEPSTTSPNKDRLTTIFLDMQNTSPKAHVFQNNSISDETNDTLDNKTPAPTISSDVTLGKTSVFMKGTDTPVVNGSSETKSASSVEKENSLAKSPNFNFGSSPLSNINTPSESKNKVESNNTVIPFNFTGSKDGAKPVNNDNKSSTTPAVQFNFGSNAPNFNFSTSPKTSLSGLGNGNILSTSPLTTGNNQTTSSNDSNTTNGEKKEDGNNQTMIKPFTFGTSTENGLKKPDFSTFKFGTEGILTIPPNETLGLSQSTNANQTSSAALKVDSTALASSTATTAPTAITTSTSTSTTTSLTSTFPQFSFGSKSSDVTSGSGTIQPSGGIQFGQPISSGLSSMSNPFSAPTKSLYTLGQNSLTSPNQQSSTEVTNSSNKDDEKSETPKTNFSLTASVTASQVSSTTTTPAVFGQSIQSGGFTFGQKPISADTSSHNTKPTFGTEQNDTQNRVSQAKMFGQSTTSQANVFSQSGNTFQTAVSSQGTTFIPPASSQTTSFSQNTAPQTSTTGGQTNGTNSLFTFGQAKPATSEVPTSTPSAPDSTTASDKPAFGFTFGQKTETQNSDQTKPSEAPVFGIKSQSNLFSFGQKSTTQEPAQNTTAPSTFGQNSTNNTGLFLQKPANPPSLFGVETSQANSTDKTTNPVPAFGQTQNSLQQTTNGFGAKSEAVTFGQPSAPAFGQSNSAFPIKPLFGTPFTTQSITGFGASSTTQTTAFGSAPSSQTTSVFGTPTTTQTTTGFGTATPAQSTTTFGTPATQSTTGFGLNTTNPTSSFSQPFGQNANKPSTSLVQTSNSIFGQSSINQNPVTNTGFSSTTNTNFNASGNQNIFGSKPNLFGSNNKLQAPAFNKSPTSQLFGRQNKFSFGMSTADTTGFTSTPPNTTGVFNFGSNTPAQGSTYNFGGTPSTGATNTQTPFAFNSPSSDTFKFGSSTAKEGTGFGGGNPSTFPFSAQVNNNAPTEAKPAVPFNFGNTQVSSAGSTFNFGSTPSPSVFSFGGSGSSTGSGSTFNFGTPTPGGPFGQSATPSPATPFSVPGTFSIGSGSSQSRPRASSRLRRRP